jgi:Icc-related predicted phosphoesterase
VKLRRRTRSTGDRFRLFYASDLHGSDLGWRKFLSAGRVYEASALIMGGDLTGKAIVPIVGSGDEWNASFHGREHTLTGEEAVAAFEEDVRTNGFYPYRCSPDEVDRLARNQGQLDQVFATLMTETVQRWMSLADSRLEGTGVRLYVMPGNDDELYLDEHMTGASVENCDERRIEVGGYDLYSLSWANPTPWETPREAPEDELWEHILGVIGDETDFSRAIFNFHVPPHASELDWGPALDADFQMQSEGGQAKQVPIGSTAVRRAIEEFQPLLGLHGHVHESRGVTKIGRTVCVNPGSRYAEGVVDGVIVTLEGDSVRSTQLVTG